MDTETTTELPVATPNMALVHEVFAKIKADLAHWNQATWVGDVGLDGNLCNTNFCFGGWALYLNNRLQISGDEFGRYAVAVDEHGERVAFAPEAARLLGFNDALAFEVFYNIEYDFDTFKTYTLAAIDRLGNFTDEQVETWIDED
jgi:hypothetical protein